MLSVIVPSRELWDESKEEFVYTDAYKFQIEHSLVSLSKWESKWCIPFLTKDDKTDEQIIDYIRCMTITQNVKGGAYNNLTPNIIDNIKEYINAPMTATWFTEKPGNKPHSREIVTAEIIYYWMIQQNIPMECQKWHLNRLLTLIRVCNIKNSAKPGKKLSQEALNNRRALNESRKARLNTRG